MPRARTGTVMLSTPHSDGHAEPLYQVVAPCLIVFEQARITGGPRRDCDEMLPVTSRQVNERKEVRINV
jgi:hypothetical protein